MVGSSFGVYMFAQILCLVTMLLLTHMFPVIEGQSIGAGQRAKASDGQLAHLHCSRKLLDLFRSARDGDAPHRGERSTFNVRHKPSHAA